MPTFQSLIAVSGLKLAALTVAVALAACGPTEATTGGPTHACSLLTIGEVEAALGVTALNETLGYPRTAERSSCHYKTAKGYNVAVTSYENSGGAYDFDYAYKPREGAVEIPGIADGAVVFDGTLYVKKGDTLFAIQPEVTQEQLLQIAPQIGAAAAGRMP